MNAKYVAGRMLFSVGLAAFILSAWIPATASAVSISGSTYAKDSSDPSFSRPGDAYLWPDERDDHLQQHRIRRALTFMPKPIPPATVAATGVTKVTG